MSEVRIGDRYERISEGAEDNFRLIITDITGCVVSYLYQYERNGYYDWDQSDKWRGSSNRSNINDFTDNGFYVKYKVDTRVEYKLPDELFEL